MLRLEDIRKAVQEGSVRVGDHARTGMTEEGFQPYQLPALLYDVDGTEDQPPYRLLVKLKIGERPYFAVFGRNEGATEIYMVIFSQYRKGYYKERVPKIHDNYGEYVWEDE